MLTKRQRLHWWLIEARLPKERRNAARAERWKEMAEHVDDRNERLADGVCRRASAATPSARISTGIDVSLTEPGLSVGVLPHAVCRASNGARASTRSGIHARRFLFAAGRNVKQVARPGASDEAGADGLTGANDGETRNTPPTIRCPMRCRSIRGRSAGAPGQGGGLGGPGILRSASR
jgi:hypothetical protein